MRRQADAWDSKRRHSRTHLLSVGLPTLVGFSELRGRCRLLLAVKLPVCWLCGELAEVAG